MCELGRIISNRFKIGKTRYSRKYGLPASVLDILSVFISENLNTNKHLTTEMGLKFLDWYFIHIPL